MAQELLLLGIRIVVEDGDVGKLQTELKAVGVETQALAGQTSGLTQATQGNAVATAEHAAKQGTLHEALGSSRRETVFLEQALVQLTGATGVAAHGFEALMTGIGPVGLALVGISAVIEIVAGKIAEKAKADQDGATALLAYAEAQAKKNKTVADSAPNLAKTVDAEKAHQEALKASSAEVYQLGKALADSENQLAHIRTLFEANEVTAETLATAYQNVTDATSAYNAAVGKLDALQAFDAAMADVNTTVGKAPEQLDSAAQHFESLDGLLLMIADDARKADDALNAVAGQAAQVGPNVAAMNKFLADDKVAEMIKAGNDALAARTKALNAAESAAKQFASAQAAAAKSEAEAQSKFTETVREVSQVLTADQQAKVQMIIDTAASAEEKLKMLNAYFGSLPSSKEINILLTFGGKLDLAKALGLINPGIAGGNQQGNQALFTFWGESIATQTAFLNANGNDRAAAERAWNEQHLKEVQQSVNSGFDMSGRQLTGAERRLAQDIINAKNDKTNSSGDPYAANSDDPRYRAPQYTEYDDKGNRRNPNSGAPLPPRKTPGEYNSAPSAGAGAAAASGVPPITINATINNGMDVEELAYRVALVFKKNGR